jgi:nucleotidyltransferase substrate binding protein (TIGR01987 family)
MEKDIRWIQRLSSFKRAFASLTDDVELATERELSDIEQRGLIQAFEYTYERAWNIIKDFYQSVGESNIHGSKDAFQLAVKRGLIDSNCGSVLMESIKSRNKTIHTYNEETAEEIFQAVIHEYYQAFSTLEQALEKEEKQRKG